MYEKRIKEVFSDEAFVKGLFELDTPAEVQAALKEKGIEMTESEIIGLRDALVKLQDKVGENGELSVEQLDDVAGGELIVVSILAGITYGLAFGAFAGIYASCIDVVTDSKW